MSGARKLSEVLDEQAQELVSTWAYRNKDKVWLGKPSREKITAEVAEALRWAYELAKRKYNK